MKDEEDALLMAAARGDLPVVEAALAAGTSPDVQGQDGFSALQLAAQEFQVEAARMLLEAGATVDLTNRYGNTPLFTAVFNSQNKGEMIQLLRDAGADPWAVNRSGQTPIGLAHLIGNYDVKQFFSDLDAAEAPAAERPGS